MLIAVTLLSQFEAVGIRVWVDGGWAVDALLGQETRPHGDLDIVVLKQDVERTRQILLEMSYEDKADADARPWNFVMADPSGHEVDFHVIEFDKHGNGIYGPPDLGLSYHAGSLTGRGCIGDYPVLCISPEWLVRFHTGYDFDEQDIQDVMALHVRFNVPLPDEYVPFIGSLGLSRDLGRHEFMLVELTPESMPNKAKLILAASLYRPTPEKIDATLKSMYASPRSRLYGLAVEGNMIAVAGIQLQGGSVAEILHIAVAQAFRGRGCGRRLIELVVDAEALMSMYAETDRDAVGFYERCGFSAQTLGEKYSGVERFLCRWMKDGTTSDA